MTCRVAGRAGGRRSRRLVSLVAAAAVLTAGLASGLVSAAAASPPASPSAGKVVLRVGWTNDPDNLNPFVGAETSSYEIWLLNYDFLVGYSLDLGPVPGLATSWEASPDGKVWTFHLREGVKWQDGEPFSARDVAFTYNYIVENQMGAYSSLTKYIKEAVAVDDLTVEIRCSRPKANMVRTWIPILPEHVWSKVSPKAAGGSFQNRPPIVGTGPFQVVEVKKGDYVRMVANPAFWGRKPVVDEILFITYQNPDTMTQDLLGGSLDAAWGVPPAQFTRLETTKGLQAIAYNLLTWDYLAMNCYEGPSRGNPVLRDVKFRRALNWAVDRQRVVDLAWGGRGEPGTTIMTPDSWVDPDYHWQPPADLLFTFDPQKAAQLLDEAGYVDADGDEVREDKQGRPIELRLWARSESPESQKTGSLVTGWLRDLGLKIRYQVIDDGIYYDSIWAYQGDTFSPDFDLYLWDWDGYADPGDTLASFTTAQIENWNEPAWSDPAFDAAVDEANTTIDPQARKEPIWRAQQIMYDQTPEIVLDYPDKLEAVDTAHWDGWKRMYGGTGAAFYTSYVRDSYLDLRPKAAAVAQSGASLTWVWVAVAAAVVVVGLAWFLLRRRRRAAAEEE